MSVDALKELQNRLAEERPVPWEEFPDLALYMDQVISYMPRQLIQLQEGEGLTSAMVNNYIKDGLLPRAEGKRYHGAHLAYLTAICALKQVLSVKEVKQLLSACDPAQQPEDFYARFRSALDGALTAAAGQLEGVGAADEDLAALALELALGSYAQQLACTRVLELLGQRAQPPAGEDHRREKKEKHRKQEKPPAEDGTTPPE
jgi:DNA-binding transcriptional MerR regulator